MSFPTFFWTEYLYYYVLALEKLKDVPTDKAVIYSSAESVVLKAVSSGHEAFNVSMNNRISKAKERLCEQFPKSKEAHYAKYTETLVLIRKIISLLCIVAPKDDVDVDSVQTCFTEITKANIQTINGFSKAWYDINFLSAFVVRKIEKNVGDIRISRQKNGINSLVMIVELFTSEIKSNYLELYNDSKRPYMTFFEKFIGFTTPDCEYALINTVKMSIDDMHFMRNTPEFEKFPAAVLEIFTWYIRDMVKERLDGHIWNTFNRALNRILFDTTGLTINEFNNKMYITKGILSILNNDVLILTKGRDFVLYKKDLYKNYKGIGLSTENITRVVYTETMGMVMATVNEMRDEKVRLQYIYKTLECLSCLIKNAITPLVVEMMTQVDASEDASVVLFARKLMNRTLIKLFKKANEVFCGRVNFEDFYMEYHTKRFEGIASTKEALAFTVIDHFPNNYEMFPMVLPVGRKKQRLEVPPLAAMSVEEKVKFDDIPPNWRVCHKPCVLEEGPATRQPLYSSIKTGDKGFPLNWHARSF